MGPNVRVANLEGELVPTPGVSDHSVTIDATVTTMSSFDSKTTHVFWSLTGNNARVTFDGSDPVAGTNGHYLPVKSSGIWRKDLAATARFTQDSAALGAVHVTEMTR